ncbi:hypothetical protein [Mesorhizobium sp. M4B.F.Ca.ET.143.01.1.1]|uniref:hypothetical protein n=1 Tax=Mesorhizobium sp. M4B.F.Ca.ET.143.01.1.1 TaxID=2563947 RepID=UPI000FE6A44B|nr:hypothetical protein [Mesorhizobium sp. M4B.F.Ca.ET.143.01.1.1]RWB98688.1 MAG: hypothetical protein EOQ57_20990 [Mesorhizobium sp.]TGV21944.1 hypothetical protein EN786_32080 [Mesorhizobium sp. M4B.F.Ca.ET.143.01.1.1]
MSDRSQHSWKEQPVTTAAISLDEIKKRHAALSRTIKRRNTLEYVAGGIAAAFLLVMSVIALLAARAVAHWVMGAGFATLALGMVFVGLYIFRKSTRVGTDMAASGMDHLKRRLEHERDLLRSAWLWYVGPMVPGFVLSYLGYWMANPERPIFVLVAGGLTFALAVFVVVLNRRAARQIESEIRSLRK